MKKVLFMLHGLVHSDVEAEETQAASLVFSSQIPGYDGGEVNTTETVEITFPLIVRNCMRTFSYFYHKMIRYDRIWDLMFYHVMYADTYTEASGMYMLNQAMDWPTVLHTVVLL